MLFLIYKDNGISFKNNFFLIKNLVFLKVELNLKRKCLFSFTQKVAKFKKLNDHFDKTLDITLDKNLFCFFRFVFNLFTLRN